MARTERCVYCGEPITGKNDWRDTEDGRAHRYCGRPVAA